MPAILVYIAGLFGRLLSAETLRFAALKLLLVAIFTTVLPVVLNQVVYSFVERAIQYANSETANISAVTIQLIGFGGYLGTQLKLPECFSIIMGFVSSRLTLRMMRVL